LGLWTLEERRNRADLLEIFKLIKGFTAVSWTYFFTRTDNGTTRGHNWKLMKKYTAVTYGITSSLNEQSIVGTV